MGGEAVNFERVTISVPKQIRRLMKASPRGTVNWSAIAAKAFRRALGPKAAVLPAALPAAEGRMVAAGDRDCMA
jgi:hypothetical protein